mmetsp:Transcript_29977/g.96724  ORF Transcript_29977/g.96724 Transcript_29977/m.96724 type:complete len:130 (+) Transcript_29977:136-525(+)
MGKGSNVAKANAAREKNLKDKGKSPEERAAAKAKADKDKQAYKCLICLQTFLVSSTDGVLFNHVTSKHDKLEKEPEKCFPKLKGFDPSAPAAAAPAAVSKKPVAAAAKKDAGLNDLLAAGLAGGKGKKK